MSTRAVLVLKHAQRTYLGCLLALLFCSLLVACGSYPEQSTLTPEERLWIENNPEGVSIGASIHYPPYEKFSPEEGYTGLSADYLTLISRKIGLTFTPVRYPNRQEVLKRIQRGDVDIVAALEMTEDRQEYLNFTQSYISIPAAIITRKEYTDDLTLKKLEGMRIGVTLSSEFITYLTEKLKVNCEVVPVAGGYIGGLRSLAVGDIDALICDMALASHYIANARISNLRIAGLTNYSIELRIASRKDQAILNSILRKGLAMVLPHERKAIEEQWLSLQYEPLWANRTFWWGTFGAVVAILIGTGLVLVWNQILKRQVAQRTAVLSSINTVLLDSLKCHTEKEVMACCLREARGLSGSIYAAWAQVQEDGALEELLSVVSEGEGSKARVTDVVRLDDGQLEELMQGGVVQYTGHPEDGLGPVHLVIVPIAIDGVNSGQVIVTARRREAHTLGEVKLVSEMTFAFEEVLHRKRTEISLHEKELQLQRVQRMEALGTLAGGIAHDFNNILGIIVGNGQMVELFHSVEDEALQAKIASILAAAERGRTLVNQILSFSRQEAEEVAPLQVSPIVRETIRFLQASLSASISITYEAESPEPYILAEPTQVHQVLMNLCTNAAHAIGQEGGAISLALRTVTFDVPEAVGTGFLQPGCYLAIDVSDTGAGMPKEVAEHIFEPFFTTKATGEGTGLGLAVVEGIIKAWEGGVSVQSEPGKGACFTVLLPTHSPPETEKGEVRQFGVPSGDGKILVVDDEPDVIELYRSFLEKLGYQVVARTVPSQALEYVRTVPDDIDLLISDFNMPEMCGDALIAEIFAFRPDLPVILCTGFSDSFTEVDAQAMGVQEYLKKPIDLRSLAQVVRKYIRPALRDADLDG